MRIPAGGTQYATPREDVNSSCCGFLAPSRSNSSAGRIRSRARVSGDAGVRGARQHCPMRNGDATSGNELTRDVISAFFDVYNYLRPGFLEAVYAGGMAIELRKRGIAF